MQYDVIVVGAGPSGAVLSYLLAEKGFKILTLEKLSPGKDKPCGGGLTYKTTKLLKDIGLELPEELKEVEATGFEIVHEKDSIMDEENFPLITLIRRKKFDMFLMEQATDYGASVHYNEEVVRVKTGSNKVNVITKSGESYVGTIVVGAGGASDIVGRELGFRRSWKADELGVAIVTESFVGQQFIKEKFSNPWRVILFLSGIKGGYSWLFPKREHLNLGVGSFVFARPNLLRSIEYTQRFFGFRLENARFRGHILPLGGKKRKLVSNNALLVGDAAGLIDPFSGEGIYYAIKSSEIAMQVIEKAFEENRFDSGFLKTYEKRIWNELGFDLMLAARAARWVYTAPLKAIELVKQNKELVKVIVDILTGEKPYRMHKKVILKLPIYAAKWITRFRKRKSAQKSVNFREHI